MLTTMGAPSDGREVHVALRGVGKRFGGTQALVDIDLDIAKGTVHGLVGENGAGKSTLGKLIAGVFKHDTGSIEVLGRPVSYGSPRDALSDGVTMLAQELMLVPRMTVLENVFLGSELVKWGLVGSAGLKDWYRALSNEAGFDLSADAKVGNLRLADQQKVEILRAFARQATLIVMDEPTAALTHAEAAGLFKIIGDLRDRGTTIIYVSHFLEEVLRIADVVTVLKDGHVVRTSPAASETPARLVHGMLGRAMNTTFPEKPPFDSTAPAVLEVRRLHRVPAFDDIEFELRPGEILGLAGLVGSGRTEVARAIFGADPKDGGEVVIDGSQVKIRHPRDAIRAGIAMLPESRKTQGLLMAREVGENITLADLDRLSVGGFIARRRENAEALESARRVDVRPLQLAGRPTSALSGGNQQKVLFAKWLIGNPRVLIADEPTRGVDVGAKRSIYALLTELASRGMAILLISSEIEEVLGLAHRVLVMRGGRIVRELSGEGMTVASAMGAAFGRSSEEMGEPQ